MLYLAVTATVFAFVVVCGIAYQALGARSDLIRFPAPGRLVNVHGHQLHLYELGSGSPTVVLESGISASSLNWRTVQSEIAKFTRVCSYDRAGLGWSELCNQPCTPRLLANQLHSLLHTAGAPPPYLLVGHSFGGLIVRAFAALFPQETSGIVLVDALDPAEWSPLTDEQRRTVAHGIRLARRGALAARLGVARLFLNLLLAGNRIVPRAAAKGWSGRASLVTDRIAAQVQKMPEETWALVASHWMQPKCFEGMARHFECLVQSIAEMEHAPTLNIPVTMLVGTQNDHPTDQQEYAKRISTKTKLIFARKSGHWIQLDEPELVANSIREMINNRT
ncbi:MAG TPA: alpha/beta hydrolase [Terriglobales bacterium]|nr:alpha/beta hydrolase [Terriglobales bacterium]